MTENFYRDLAPFTEFESVLESRHYQEAPPDWSLILTDIQGSTVAIEQGRYKHVNMIGAASITCALNHLRPLEISFVFGGAGA